MHGVLDIDKHPRAAATEVEHARIGIERHVRAHRIQDISADRRAEKFETEELRVTMHAFAQGPWRDGALEPDLGRIFHFRAAAAILTAPMQEIKMQRRIE